MHTHHAQIERVRGGECTQPEQRKSYGNLRALGQRAHLLHGAGFDNAVAGEDHGPLGVADQIRRLRQAGLLDLAHRMLAHRARLGGFKVEDRRGLLRVLGDVNEHRAGPRGTAQSERRSESPAQYPRRG